MPRFDAVLFDLDGTLLDTAPDFYQVLLEIQRRRGLHPVPFEAVRTRASDGSRAMLKLVFGDAIEESELKPLVAEFLELYKNNPVAHGSLFDGVDELLSDLEQKQIPWGIVTNKPRYLSEIVLRDLQLSARCSVLVCPEDISQSKPSPEGLLLAARLLNLDASRCLYLGDHQRDIDAGNAAEMTTIACEFGYLKPNESVEEWDAHHRVQHSAQLPQFIRELIA